MASSRYVKGDIASIRDLIQGRQRRCLSAGWHYCRLDPLTTYLNGETMQRALRVVQSVVRQKASVKAEGQLEAPTQTGNQTRRRVTRRACFLGGALTSVAATGLNRRSLSKAEPPAA